MELILKSFLWMVGKGLFWLLILILLILIGKGSSDTAEKNDWDIHISSKNEGDGEE